MKKLLLFLFYGVHIGTGQEFNFNNLVSAVSLPSSRANNFVSQKGFYPAGAERVEDTLIRNYQYRGKNKSEKKDTIQRYLSRISTGNSTTVVYRTGCRSEYTAFVNELKQAGFVSNNSDNDSTGFFQKNDLVLQAGIDSIDGLEIYSFSLSKITLPQLRDIYYADDLLSFVSHESLVYVFGANNVKKDIYYFSEKELSRCSVLFPNTSRQAVFIWDDEINSYGLHHIIFGGQLMVEGLLNYNQVVAQNNWTLRSRLHAGMSLDELRRFNEADFSFYNAHLPYSGLVIGSAAGKINFDQENVVLACLDCNGDWFTNRDILRADETIASGRRYFVFSIMLYPK